MKQKWCKEEHIDCWTRNEGNGITCLKAEVWKVRGIRRESRKGRCLVCAERRMTNIRIFLKRSKTKK
jgi:hypothetical protein